jgi:hypothetical protein
MKYLHLELKICEGCGALWLRTGITDGVYCTACRKWLDGFPEPTGKRAGGRPRLARVKGCCAAGATEVCDERGCGSSAVCLGLCPD